MLACSHCVIAQTVYITLTLHWIWPCIYGEHDVCVLFVECFATLNNISSRINCSLYKHLWYLAITANLCPVMGRWTNDQVTAHWHIPSPHCWQESLTITVYSPLNFTFIWFTNYPQESHCECRGSFGRGKINLLPPSSRLETMKIYMLEVKMWVNVDGCICGKVQSWNLSRWVSSASCNVTINFF